MQIGNRASFIAGCGVGCGVGMAALYVLDPVTGSRRRALLRDQLVRAGHASRHMASVTSRDLYHRSQGAFASIWSKLKPEEVSDDILTARVRSKLGCYVSHPHSIDVDCRNGEVILKGLVLDHEVNQLVKAIAKVKGVQTVSNRMRAHSQSENISSLQGGTPRRGERLDLFQRKRSPATNFLIGLSGISALLYGLTRRDKVVALVSNSRVTSVFDLKKAA